MTFALGISLNTGFRIKMMKRIYIGIVIMSALLSFTDSLGQYGYGGYGGGYGGYGGGYGYNRLPRADFPAAKRKDPNAFDPEEFATKQTKWMKKKLDLDGEQELKADSLNIMYAFKIYDIFEDFKKLIGPLKPEDKPSQELMDKVKAKREEIKTQISQYQEQKDKGLKTILNDTQWATYEKKKRTLADDIANN